jgi:hypothetical protein
VSFWFLYITSNSRAGASVWDVLLFSYTTKVVLLGNTAESLNIGDLPIVPGSMRATYLFRSMRSALSTIHLRRFIYWDIRPGSGWELAYRLAYVNRRGFMAQMALAAIGAVLYYAPPFFFAEVGEVSRNGSRKARPELGMVLLFRHIRDNCVSRIQWGLPSFDRPWD